MLVSRPKTAGNNWLITFLRTRLHLFRLLLFYYDLFSTFYHKRGGQVCLPRSFGYLINTLEQK